METINLQDMFLRVSHFLNENCLNSAWNARKDDALEIVIIHRTTPQHVVKIEKEILSLDSSYRRGVSDVSSVVVETGNDPQTTVKTLDAVFDVSSADGDDSFANHFNGKNDDNDEFRPETRRPQRQQHQQQQQQQQPWTKTLNVDGEEVKIFGGEDDSYFDPANYGDEEEEEEEEEAADDEDYAPPTESRTRRNRTRSSSRRGRHSVSISTVDKRKRTRTNRTPGRPKKTPSKPKATSTSMHRKMAAPVVTPEATPTPKLPIVDNLKERGEWMPVAPDESLEGVAAVKAVIPPKRKRVRRKKGEAVERTYGGRPLIYPELQRNDEGIIECPVCQETFDKTAPALKHYRKFHKKLCFPCKSCPREFKDVHALRLHEDIIHNDGAGELVCQICGMRFHIVPAIKYHTKRAHENPQGGENG